MRDSFLLLSPRLGEGGSSYVAIDELCFFAFTFFHSSALFVRTNTASDGLTDSLTPIRDSSDKGSDRQESQATKQCSGVKKGDGTVEVV
jgi:hypothetical protein